MVSTLIVLLDYVLLGKPMSLSQLPYRLVTGSAAPHLWFIPMICCCFIVSPLLLKLKQRYFTCLTCICALLPLLGARQGFFYPVKSAILSFAYFFPVFLFGIWYYKNRELVEKYIRTNIFTLAVLALTSCLAMVYVQFHRTAPMEQFYFIFCFIRRIAEIFVIIYFLKQTSLFVYCQEALSVFAQYSFGLYFFHFPLTIYLIYKLDPLLMSLGMGKPFIAIIRVLTVIILSVFVCKVMNKIFGKYSRQIVGC